MGLFLFRDWELGYLNIEKVMSSLLEYSKSPGIIGLWCMILSNMLHFYPYLSLDQCTWEKISSIKTKHSYWSW